MMVGGGGWCCYYDDDDQARSVSKVKKEGDGWMDVWMNVRYDDGMHFFLGFLYGFIESDEQHNSLNWMNGSKMERSQSSAHN